MNQTKKHMRPGRIVVTASGIAALALLSIGATPVAGRVAPRQAAAVPVFPTVYLGYAAGTSFHFPDPWSGSPHTQFIGAKPAKSKPGGSETHGWDTSGIRLENPGKDKIDILKVRVRFPAHHRKLSPWGSFSISHNKTVILASTDTAHGGNFDGSENNVPGAACDVNATTSAPVIRITLKSGAYQKYVDTGHVLDAGGFEPAHCGQNESETWRVPGSAAGPFSQ